MQVLPLLSLHGRLRIVCLRRNSFKKSSYKLMTNGAQFHFQKIEYWSVSVITSQSATNMSQPSLKQWYEDRKRLRVDYDHSRSKPVERKNKIKKSRQAAVKSALAERTTPSGQYQDTKTNTSDSSLGKEQFGAQEKRYRIVHSLKQSI